MTNYAGSRGNDSASNRSVRVWKFRQDADCPDTFYVMYPPKHVVRKYLRLDHDHVVSHNFLFIIYQWTDDCI